MTTRVLFDAGIAVAGWWSARGRRFAHRTLWVYLLLTVCLTLHSLVDQAADPDTFRRVYDDPELVMTLGKVGLATNAVALALQATLLGTGRFSLIAVLLVVADIGGGVITDGWIKTCCG
jgi:hypothetical protein